MPCPSTTLCLESNPNKNDTLHYHTLPFFKINYGDVLPPLYSTASLDAVGLPTSLCQSFHNHVSQGQCGCTSKKDARGFPGGPAIKNLHANARDTGSISGLGRFHLHRGN